LRQRDRTEVTRPTALLSSTYFSHGQASQAVPRPSIICRLLRRQSTRKKSRGVEIDL